MCRLSIHYDSSSLSSRDIKSEGGYMGLVPMKKLSIGILIGAGICNMAQSFIV
jgi:hypothetical protein